MAISSQSSQITIVVTSANGTQGHAVISALACRNAALPAPHTLSIRALVRDPSSSKSQGLLKLSQRNTSIILVQADFNSPETLHTSFIPDNDGRAINSVFLNTSPTFNDPQEEVRHATAVLDAAREAGVKHVVYVSTPQPIRQYTTYTSSRALSTLLTTTDLRPRPHSHPPPPSHPPPLLGLPFHPPIPPPRRPPSHRTPPPQIKPPP
ncbi:hypothetical protein GRF29_154g179608 [Pseudopithomyces chartarum]|uniref:NmrA-like domain-containing protein n=1 Tax=Pseudopithomyces chartarum TaxID=1892770 RepID=A0AAN6LT52_9PLEO|nr:hypothetical protein GRF29_154g179608 [Pseudopithomyces chartarum]